MTLSEAIDMDGVSVDTVQDDEWVEFAVKSLNAWDKVIKELQFAVHVLKGERRTEIEKYFSYYSAGIQFSIDVIKTMLEGMEGEEV